MSKYLYCVLSDWLAHSGRSDFGRVPVPGLVEVKQLGLKEGEVDDLTSLPNKQNTGFQRD